MKRMICIITSILLVIFLSACHKRVEKIENPPEHKSEERALFELDLRSLGDISVCGLDSNADYTAVLYFDSIGEAGDGVPDEEPEPLHYQLALFDTKNNTVIKTIDFENPDDQYYDVVLDQKLSLVNRQGGEIISYDLSLENREESICEAVENWERAEKIGIDISQFACYDHFAITSNFGVAQTLTFYDQPNTYYMIKSNIWHDFRASDGHSVLVTDTEGSIVDEPDVLRVFDFDKMQETNHLKLPNSEPFSQVCLLRINKDRVSVSTVLEQGGADKIYVWNYHVKPTEQPFEDGYCEVVAENEIDSKITQLEDRIKEACGVRLECSPEAEFIREQYEYANDVQPIIVYQKALDLEYDLSLFPKELYSELLCSNLEAPVASFDDFRLYLVGSFPDRDIDAYASNIGCEETDDEMIVYIVFSCTGLNQRTFFHEIMHTLEYRIWNYEEDFEDRWCALNPDGFLYDEDYLSTIDYYEELQDCFAREYGTNSALEDRATCFEELCDGCLTDSIWWKDSPCMVAKEKLLAETIEKSFPCLADRNIWKTELTQLEEEPAQGAEE